MSIVMLESMVLIMNQHLRLHNTRPEYYLMYATCVITCTDYMYNG